MFTEIDECEALPCQNGGTCVEEVEGYTCQCTDQFFGENCTGICDIVFRVSLNSRKLAMLAKKEIAKQIQPKKLPIFWI